jgi:hypothetical protein
MLPHTTIRVAGLLLFLAAGSAEAQAGKDAKPLFTSNVPLRITLTADFDEIRDNRDDTIPHPASLVYSAGDSVVGPIEIKLWVRGNYRRQKSVCSFPPLRLDFDKDDDNLAEFDGQNRIKMVVNCRDNDDYEQYVLKEYIAYRLLNLLTDESFRVRLVQATYQDASGKRDPETRWSFLLEDDDDLAERLGAEVLDIPQIDPFVVDASRAVRMAIFQYMIGNTDESPLALHNVVAMQVSGILEFRFVPYDFDWSGLVSARYARPDQRLNISNVRQRIYRGYCRPEADYAAMFARFVEMRPAAEAMIREVPGLDEGEAKRVLSYLDEFYRVISNPGRADREIVRNCRG